MSIAVIFIRKSSSELCYLSHYMRQKLKLGGSRPVADSGEAAPPPPILGSGWPPPSPSYLELDPPLYRWYQSYWNIIICRFRLLFYFISVSFLLSCCLGVDDNHSQLCCDRHLYKTDTSLRKTPTGDPWAGPTGVRLRGSWLYLHKSHNLR